MILAVASAPAVFSIGVPMLILAGGLGLLGLLYGRPALFWPLVILWTAATLTWTVIWLF